MKTIKITDDVFKQFEPCIHWLIVRELKLLGIDVGDFKKNYHDVFDDMKQEGARVLLESSQTFDDSKGASFKTYSCYNIAYRVRFVLFKHINNKELSMDSLFDTKTSAPLCEDDTLDYERYESFFDASVFNTNTSESELQKREYKVPLMDAWLLLDKFERYLLTKYYVEECTLAKIAEDIKYSVPFVSRHLRTALQSLRESLERLYGITSFYDIG